jgi:hypothetical protein
MLRTRIFQALNNVKEAIGQAIIRRGEQKQGGEIGSSRAGVNRKATGGRLGAGLGMNALPENCLLTFPKNVLK